MRTINLIVIHCSATREDKDFTEYDLDVCHRRRGFNGAGYHFYIRKNGDIKSTRPIEKVGAHAKGFNRESIGICYEGGLDSKGRPKDTRTEWQKHSLRVLVLTLLKDYPECRVCGHRDLSPDRNENGAGYHFYIRKNGDIKSTRPIEKVGAHAKGFNRESIGICYEGGLDSKGRPKDTRTEWQKHSLRVLVLTLLKDYPECRVCGHRDLSPDRNENGEIEPEEWVKACPCFDAENNWKA